MVAKVTAANVRMSSDCPGRSTRRGRGALVSGAYRATRAKAMAATGTLTRKTARHPTVATSRPPRIGPEAAATPNTPAHTPIARARRAGSVMTLVMVDRALGCSMAPPTACTIRNAMRVPSPGATEQATEATANRPSPAANSRRRPNRSPRADAVSSSTANVRV